MQKRYAAEKKYLGKLYEISDNDEKEIELPQFIEIMKENQKDFED